MLRYLDHSFDNLRRFRRYQHFQHLQYDQRFLFLLNRLNYPFIRLIAERLLFLGPDLSAAHFLVHRGAAIKFAGDETWYKRDAKKVK